MNQIDMRAVADRAGVSIATVSRSLRGLELVRPETRAAVERAATELGYVVSASASGLATGRQRMIGVVVPSLAQWYHVAAMEGADEVFRGAGYDTMLVNLGRASALGNRLFRTALLRKRVDALLVVAVDCTAHEVEQLEQLHLPNVGVGGTRTSRTRVEIDEIGVARAATRHLVELGHRRIWHVGGTDNPDTDAVLARQRAAGWRAALRDVGVDPAPHWQSDGTFFAPRARAVALEMLRNQDRPTAIYAASDEMAFGVLQAARDLRLSVPGDLSVIGTDDHAYADLLGLTTMRQDPRAQAREAATTLLEMMTGVRDSEQGVVEAPVELVVRSSTQALRGAR